MVIRRRAFRAVRRDYIVSLNGSSLGIHCPDSDDVGIVPWRGDRAVSIVAHGVQTPRVPCGHDNYDTRFPGLFDGLAERIERGALVNRPTEGEIYHSDVVLVLEL